MQDFSYYAVTSIDEAVALLNHGKQARILGGGTDLLVQLREGRRSAEVVIDIKCVPELCAVHYDPESGLTIGAAASCMRVVDDERVRTLYPGLVDAISIIGGTQIQGRASVGGNLCNASPAADSAPALIVHSAVCMIAGPGGMRELPVESFFVGPGRCALQPDELLVAVCVPDPGRGFGAAYLRFIPRNEMDIAVVGAGAAVRLDEEKQHFTWGRLALGAVAPTPLLVQEAGEFLEGKPVSADVILEAARIAQAAARPITDMRGTAAQRKHLSLVLARRALEAAVMRARGEKPGADHTAEDRR